MADQKVRECIVFYDGKLRYAYFHTWSDEIQITNDKYTRGIFGIVEMKDTGSVKKIEPEHIQFISSDCK